jgi:hypothetical protein
MPAYLLTLLYDTQQVILTLAAAAAAAAATPPVHLLQMARLYRCR